LQKIDFSVAVQGARLPKKPSELLADFSPEEDLLKTGQTIENPPDPLRHHNPIQASEMYLIS
jgi:hypothetical protein